MKKKVSILSLNCALWPPAIGPRPAERPSHERFADIMQLAQQYDLVFLQELFSSYWDNQWIKQIKESGWYSSRLPRPTFGSKPLNAGLVILSRRPIIVTEWIPLPGGGPLHWARPFAVQCAKTMIENSPITLLNTHLLAREAFIGRGGPGPIRQQQLDILQQQIPATGSWLLAGDFNSNPDSPAILSFRQALGEHTNVFWPASNTTHNQIKFAAHHPEGATRTDHFYSNLSLTNGRILTEYPALSDHFPISCTAKLPN